MDIHSKGKGSAAVLSNFAHNPFTFRGHAISSMEALLQSLKMPSPSGQLGTWPKFGINAKKAGGGYRWHTKQMLYWQGAEMHRLSAAYQRFLNEAYLFLCLSNKKFRDALNQVPDREPLTHKIGKSKPLDTVLTESEFVSRLQWLRGLKLTDEDCERILLSQSEICLMLTDVPNQLKGKALKRSS